MDYEAPVEHNPEYANVKSWSVVYTCRCGQWISVHTEARYVRNTCPSCKTVWEVSPSICDSTPYAVEKHGQPEDAP
jgi:phage FluMu protein Com